MSEPDAAVINGAVGNAIEQVIQEQESGFTLKWIAIAETLNENGERGVWMMTSDEITQWDQLGLLEYAKNRALREAFYSDEEEDD